MASYEEALEADMIDARVAEIKDRTITSIVSSFESIINSIKNQIIKIPQSSEYCANRYDTDDEHVIHLWDTKGNSYDIRIKK